MQFIDSHTHLWLKGVITQEMRENSARVGYEIPVLEKEKVIKEMDEANLEYVVIIAYPMRKLWGAREDFPVRMIQECKDYPDRFSVVGGVEVNQLTLEETRNWLETQYSAGVSGFKLHPPHMWVKPNDYREEERGLKQLELLYQFSQDHGLPVIIHTGTSFFLPARNKYGDPIYLDDVSVDFPKLKIVMAHLGRPNWVDTAFQLLRIRRNVMGDLSSIPPKRLLEYFPRLGEVEEKVVYGSDSGGPGVKGLKTHLEEFLRTGLQDSSKVKIAYENPKRVFRTLER